ncbi:hypothetical protein H4S08_001498 [Coemansia sp. RSA 1365]|nr:hypothetical protein H4S08_001498 [Coemansia sp. RSA 1365]
MYLKIIQPMFARVHRVVPWRGFRTASVQFGSYPYRLIRDTKPSVLPRNSQPDDRILAALMFTKPANDNARSIIGWVYGDPGADSQSQIDPRHFIENDRFWPAVQRVFEEHAHEDPELQALAAYQKTGWLNITDGRNPPPLGRTGNPEDIFGSVKLDDQAIKPHTFQSNLAYRPVTANGLFQLPKYLHGKLVEYLS